MSDLRLVAAIVTGWCIIVGIVTFALMSWDKRAARRKRRRVPESRLLWAAVVGGAWGAWAAMVFVRHKTRHLRFRIVVPAASALWAALVVWLWTQAPGATFGAFS